MENDHQQTTILHLLESIYQKQKFLDEKLDCILHVLCKHNTEKCHESIRKFINSDFRK